MLPSEVHNFISHFYGYHGHPVAVAIGDNGTEYVVTKRQGHRTIAAYAANGTWRTLGPQDVPDGLTWALYWARPL